MNNYLTGQELSEEEQRKVAKALQDKTNDDPWLNNMRWPGVGVHSGQFNNLPIPEKLYQQSQAFIKSALVLCENAGDKAKDIQWSDASVCYYCLHLATELFLKACIYSKKGKPKKLSHEISELRKEYFALLPEEKYFFHTPWSVSKSDLEAIGIIVSDSVDRKPNELYRYGMDKNEKSPEGLHNFTPGYFFNYMKDLKSRWEDIWSDLQR
jgi:hypothetical protein